MVLTRRSHKDSCVRTRNASKSGGISCIEEKLSDYLNTKGADVLWGSNIRLTENELQEIIPEKEQITEKNVITECAMCNEELTSNHVCREYLERLQPHAHFSTVPKGGGEITLTQTSEECRNKLTTLDSGSMYVEEEGSIFQFNSPAAHIDVISSKGDYDDHELSSPSQSGQVLNITSSKDGTSVESMVKHPFSTSWISAVYSKDLFTYDQAMLCQRATYCYPILTKLDSGTVREDDRGGGDGGLSENDPTVTTTAQFYHNTPPKFVRSVKRLKRDAYFTSEYQDDTREQNKLTQETSIIDHSSLKSTTKRRPYPTSYKSAQATKNTSVGVEDVRHEVAPMLNEPPKKKRKYVRRTTKEEQIENGTALWQFLMRKLEDKQCKGWIRWTGNDLEFKVLDQKEAAKQWGLVKKRAKMTFDKFSRSMRFYYSKGILVHNPDKRLTYIFCRQPHDPVYTEMLERVMKTLPPNTMHCTATCINPEHDHERIKLHVRKRPKKPKMKPILVSQHSNSHVDSGGESLPDSMQNIGLQMDSDHEQYHIGLTRSLIPEYVQMPYPSDHPTPGSPGTYPSGTVTDSGFCSGSQYSSYRTDQEVYSSSPMAALIAAASQAVAVPVPEPNVYPPMEMESISHHPTSQQDANQQGPHSPTCGTPNHASMTDIMMSDIGDFRPGPLTDHDMRMEQVMKMEQDTDNISNDNFEMNDTEQIQPHGEGSERIRKLQDVANPSFRDNLCSSVPFCEGSQMSILSQNDGPSVMPQTQIFPIPDTKDLAPTPEMLVPETQVSETEDPFFEHETQVLIPNGRESVHETQDSVSESQFGSDTQVTNAETYDDISETETFVPETQMVEVNFPETAGTPPSTESTQFLNSQKQDTETIGSTRQPEQETVTEHKESEHNDEEKECSKQKINDEVS